MFGLGKKVKITKDGIQGEISMRDLERMTAEGIKEHDAQNAEKAAELGLKPIARLQITRYPGKNTTVSLIGRSKDLIDAFHSGLGKDDDLHEIFHDVAEEHFGGDIEGGIEATESPVAAFMKMLESQASRGEQPAEAEVEEAPCNCGSKNCTPAPKESKSQTRRKAVQKVIKDASKKKSKK